LLRPPTMSSRPAVSPVLRASCLVRPNCKPRLFLLSLTPPPALHSFPTRRSSDLVAQEPRIVVMLLHVVRRDIVIPIAVTIGHDRSEEHTSELQSRVELVCRLLLENKNTRARTDVDIGSDVSTIKLVAH